VQVGGGMGRIAPVNRDRPPDPCAGASAAATRGFSTAARVDATQALAWAPRAPAAGFGTFAFSGSDATSDLDLYVQAGPAGARVEGGPGADSDPRWVPGSARRVIFTSARTGSGDLYLVDLDQGELTRLTDAPRTAELYAAPSPDGTRVAYVAHDPEGDHIWLRPDLAAGTPSRRLTDWRGLQVRPSWRPDGGALAFYANRDDPTRFDLYVVELPDGAPKRLIDGVHLDPSGPAWTPDGRALVVVQADDDRFNPVARVDATTGATTEVPTGTLGNGDLDLVVGVDGRTWLAISALGRHGDTAREYRRIYTMALPAP
jgi:Tol biopolymer transport system component